MSTISHISFSQEAEKASQALQFIQDSLPTNIPSTAEPEPRRPTAEVDVVMADQTSDGGVKRKAEEELSENNKKPKTGLLLSCVPLYLF